MMNDGMQKGRTKMKGFLGEIAFIVISFFALKKLERVSATHEERSN